MSGRVNHADHICNNMSHGPDLVISHEKRLELCTTAYVIVNLNHYRSIRLPNATMQNCDCIVVTV